MTTAFHAQQPTQVVAGSGLIDHLGDYVASYGRRALLVVGDSHACESGLLARVEGALRAADVQIEGLEGVDPNPSVATVDAGAALARAWRADVIVGIGGGSVLDVAKAIAVAATDPAAASFRTHLSGLRNPSLLVIDALPVVAVPTLPGAASETNGTSVITDDETGRKLSASSELAIPRMALLDVDLLADAPSHLIGSGLIDAWCHAVEAMLSTRASVASDALAEQALTLLQRHMASALDAANPFSERRDALTACWWATNLAGQALSMAGSIVTHPLAHALSARFDARHADAVAALEAAVIATIAERITESGAVHRVAHALDVRRADDPEAALRGVLSKLQRACATAGVEAAAATLGVSGETADVIVRDARLSGSRGLSNVPGAELESEELYAIIDLAAAITPSSSPKRVLDLRDAQRARAAAVAPSS